MNSLGKVRIILQSTLSGKLPNWTWNFGSFSLTPVWLTNLQVFLHQVIFRSQAFWKKAHKKTPLTRSVPSPASCGLSQPYLLLGTSPSDKNSFSASVCIFIFPEAFFLSILLFWVLVSLDDFSYAGLSPTASFSGLGFCAAWTHWSVGGTVDVK